MLDCMIQGGDRCLRVTNKHVKLHVRSLPEYNKIELNYNCLQEIYTEGGPEWISSSSLSDSREKRRLSGSPAASLLIAGKYMR